MLTCRHHDTVGLLRSDAGTRATEVSRRDHADATHIVQVLHRSCLSTIDNSLLILREHHNYVLSEHSISLSALTLNPSIMPAFSKLPLRPARPTTSTLIASFCP